LILRALSFWTASSLPPHPLCPSSPCSGWPNVFGWAVFTVLVVLTGRFIFLQRWLTFFPLSDSLGGMGPFLKDPRVRDPRLPIFNVLHGYPPTAGVSIGSLASLRFLAYPLIREFFFWVKGYYRISSIFRYTGLFFSFAFLRGLLDDTCPLTILARQLS